MNYLYQVIQTKMTMLKDFKLEDVTYQKELVIIIMS